MKENKIYKYISEAIGTFALVFVGTGAIVVNRVSDGQITHMGIGFAFGLIVLVMIYTIGHISGAHINPAVTLGFYFSKKLQLSEVPPYIFAQLLGASFASLLLKLLFYRHAVDSIGMTLPSGPWYHSFIFEFIFTYILMLVISSVATDHRAQGMMAGVAIGSTIALSSIVAGPISGASMNPARSFGPALLSLNFTHHWIYWIAPILGSLAGAKTYGIIRCVSTKPHDEAGCC